MYRVEGMNRGSYIFYFHCLIDTFEYVAGDDNAVDEDGEKDVVSGHPHCINSHRTWL